MAFTAKQPLRLALLAGLGGAIGGGQALLGLLLSGGDARFGLAFGVLGALAWLAARTSRRPFAYHMLKLAGRVGAVGLAVCAGTGASLLWAAHAGQAPEAALALAGAVAALMALGGAVTGVAVERPLRTRSALAGLLAAFLAGFAAGAALGQFFTWDTAKFFLWGAANGAALGLALSWLIRNVAGRDTAGSRRIEQVFLFLVVLLLLFNSKLPAAWDDMGLRNLYVDQARAFLQGRLDVQGLSNPDISHFGGKAYFASPPFPAVVLLPIVWAQGVFAISRLPITLISASLVALSAALLNNVLRKLALGGTRRYWVLAAFAFGTGYWAMVLDADVFATYFALVVSAPCMLLAMREALGRGRGWLVGLYLGFATNSRQLEVLAVILLAALLVEGHRGMAWHRQALSLGGLALGLGVCVSLYLVFNYARFGDPLTSGQAYLQREDYQLARYEQFGLFSPAYILNNLYYTFLHGFSIEFQGAARLAPLRMDGNGTAITYASPFLILAVWGRWKPRVIAAAWASVALILIALLCFYTNGWIQINTQRYALDYVPILIVLVALAAKRVRVGILEGLTVYAIGLNVLALIFVK